MADRPMLFSGPMVRAILDGRKTQTRRVVKPQPDDDGHVTVGEIGASRGVAYLRGDRGGQCLRVPCPYGQPGDRLWVREAFAIVPRTAYRCSEGVQQTLRPDDPYEHDAAIYREGWERSRSGFRWKPSIHMPRWASRITLEITGVRVERLQDISDADSRAEGIYTNTTSGIAGLDAVTRLDGSEVIAMPGVPRMDYCVLWDQINGAGSWAANPWVWVIEFRRV